MQAGARKKELLERLGGQAVPQITPVQTLTTPTQPQTTSTPPSVAPNGVKSRLQNPIVEQKQRLQNPQRLVPQLQSPSIAAPPEDVTPIQTQTNAVRKRTVMQRINTGSLASPQIPQKVRVVKRLTGVSIHLSSGYGAVRKSSPSAKWFTISSRAELQNENHSGHVETVVTFEPYQGEITTRFFLSVWRDV